MVRPLEVIALLNQKSIIPNHIISNILLLDFDFYKFKRQIVFLSNSYL